MRNIRKYTFGLIAVLSMSFITNTESPIATAESIRKDSAQLNANNSRATLIQPENRNIAKYNEKEVLQLLLAGQGPIADHYPEAEKALGFKEDRTHASKAEVDRLVDLYLRYNPQFESTILERLLSEDPTIFERALIEFYEDLTHFLRNEVGVVASKEGNTKGRSQFFGRVNVNNGVVVNIGVHANVAVNVNVLQHANVAVVAVAAAAIAVAVAVIYLDNQEMSATQYSSLDKDIINGKIHQALMGR